MAAKAEPPSAYATAADSLRSSAVTGLPSDHLAFGWMCTVSFVPPEARSQLLAMAG